MSFPVTVCLFLFSPGGETLAPTAYYLINYNNPYMKTVLSKLHFIPILIALTTLTATCLSCSDDNDEDTYYVKYEVDVVAASPTATNIVAVTNDQNASSYVSLYGATRRKIVYGPVQEGFVANITATDLTEAEKHSFRISVSKNGSPFALKAEGDTRYMNLQYTIDD